MLQKCLEDLEKRINPDAEEKLMNEWIAFCDGHFNEPLFSPKRTDTSPSSFEWPKTTNNEALSSYEKMALQQLAVCSQALKDGNGLLMCVRANYGVGILPSVFGASIHVMEDKLDLLPTSVPFHSTEHLIELVKKGRPELSRYYGKNVFEMGDFYKQLFAPYPNIRRYVHVYHPDLQGPLNLCELLWGSELFTEVYLNPEWVIASLDLITDTYIAFLKKWFELFPPTGKHAVHWGWLHKGTVMLRDDSATNFSGDMFDEFARPYNQRILNEFGGGAIHFCGKGNHLLDRISTLHKLYSINVSQPHLNNLDILIKNTVDKGLSLLGLNSEAAEQVLSKRKVNGLIH